MGTSNTTSYIIFAAKLTIKHLSNELLDYVMELVGHIYSDSAVIVDSGIVAVELVLHVRPLQRLRSVSPPDQAVVRVSVRGM